MAFLALQIFLVLLKLTHILADSSSDGPAWTEEVGWSAFDPPLPDSFPQDLYGDAQLGDKDDVDVQEGQQVLQWNNAGDFYGDEPAVTEYEEEEDVGVPLTYADVEDMDEMEPEAADDEDDYGDVMPVEEEVFAEEVVYGEHQVDDVEEDHPIDGGRLREYSEDEEVEVSGEEETREETVELGYAEEDVVSIDDVEHVSKEGEVDAEKEFVDEEVRYGEDATEEVDEVDEDVPETCWSSKDGNVSCLSLDPASAADRLVLAMLEQRRNMASKCKLCEDGPAPAPAYQS